MLEESLKNKRIAFLVADGFEEEELTRPKRALSEMGAITHIISPEKGRVKAWNHTDWGNEYAIDVHLPDASIDDYDALVLPGGVINPDKLRRNDKAIEFTRGFMKSNKIVAAICHGGQTLIETGTIKGRKMTSFQSIKTDLINAGAKWEDREVIIDGNLVTSRKPDDIPAFTNRIATLVAGK